MNVQTMFVKSLSCSGKICKIRFHAVKKNIDIVAISLFFEGIVIKFCFLIFTIFWLFLVNIFLINLFIVAIYALGSGRVKLIFAQIVFI